MSRRVLPILLCFLLVTWGTCPCVFARMVRISGTEDDASGEAAAPCCCCSSESAPVDDEPPLPDPDECPCCSNGGNIRDLPPQASVEMPEAPPPQLLDFHPQVAEPYLGLALALPLLCEASTGPPPIGNALHACPVGIVLLLN